MDFRGSFLALVHSLLRILLPLILFTLVSLELVTLAFTLVFLFKWRVLAVKLRYWAINIQSNLVDVIVGVSVVEFMSQVTLQGRLGWLIFYIIWIVYVKHLSSHKGSIAQAFVAQVIGVSALLYSFRSIDFAVMMLGIWFISYFSARHVLNITEESHGNSIAHAWGLFSVQLAWVLGHWQLWYWIIPQVVLLQGLAFAPLSYLHVAHKAKTLRPFTARVVIASTSVSVLATLLLADWQDKVI